MKGIFKITEHYSVGTVRNYPCENNKRTIRARKRSVGD